MATRAQLRTTIREHLEDTSGAPLWSDAALNEYLSSALRIYGASFPIQATAATAAIATGVTEIALPAGVTESRIVAVRDARGRDVPRSSGRTAPAPIDASGLMQAWSAWAGTMRLQRPASAEEVGPWTVDYLAGRELVADDVSQQSIESGDEPIVVALAAARALQRRVVEDAKRGIAASGRTPAADPATVFRREAERLMAARKRRVRGGVLTQVG